MRAVYSVIPRKIMEVAGPSSFSNASGTPGWCIFAWVCQDFVGI